MELTLKRHKFYKFSTIGELFVNGEPECFTLEDTFREKTGKPVNEWKIKGLTAVPSGRYEVIIDFSQRFKRPLIRLLNVPGFEGIRIHAGNKPEDTEGCILVGRVVLGTNIGMSKSALDTLQPKVQKALDKDEHVFITIANNGD